MLHLSECLRFIKIPSNAIINFNHNNGRLCTLAITRDWHNSKTVSDWNCYNFALAKLHLNHRGSVFSVLTQQRFAATSSSNRKASLVQSEQRSSADLTLAEKVKERSKDATYTGVIVAGLVVTGVMFYAIGKELFSGQSPSGVYSNAFKQCRKHDEVVAMFGEPLKAYGETSSRGRRRYVRHAEYEKDGVKHMRLVFYLEGPFHKGTVHVDAKQDERGKYQFVYIVVEPERFAAIVVVDNR